MNDDNALEAHITANARKQRDLNEKTEKEIMEKKKKLNNKKKLEFVSIKDVPPEILFTKYSIWKAINMNTLVEFELSGTNVSLYLGQNEPMKELLAKGELDAFQKDNLHISFKSAYMDV